MIENNNDKENQKENENIGREIKIENFKEDEDSKIKEKVEQVEKLLTLDELNKKVSFMYKSIQRRLSRSNENFRRNWNDLKLKQEYLAKKIDTYWVDWHKETTC